MISLCNMIDSNKRSFIDGNYPWRTTRWFEVAPVVTETLWWLSLMTTIINVSEKPYMDCEKNNIFLKKRSCREKTRDKRWRWCFNLFRLRKIYIFMCIYIYIYICVHTFRLGKIAIWYWFYIILIKPNSAKILMKDVNLD